MTVAANILEFVGSKILDNTSEPNELLAGCVCLTMANMLHEAEADIDGAAAHIDKEWGMIAKLFLKIIHRGAVRNEPYPGAAEEIFGLKGGD